MFIVQESTRFAPDGARVPDAMTAINIPLLTELKLSILNVEFTLQIK
jgi:hypothetical protein